MLIHVVQRGDTLWNIAQRYGVSVDDIVSVNEVENPNVLVVGQSLVIPVSNRYHTIQPGETLWEIAQRYGTTVEAIVAQNNIADPSLIYAGQILEIPVNYHTVQPGENLWEIARSYNTTIEAIARLNGITNPDLIYPGTVLAIPEGGEPVIEANAYVTNMGETGQNIVRGVGEYLTYLSPFSYHVQEDGTLRSLNDDDIIQVALSENVAPLMVLTNFRDGEFSSELAHTIFTNPGLQDDLIANILGIMQAKGYHGLNIDFEYVLPEDRERYNQFLRQIVDRLHEQGYFVSTALAPKDSAEQQGLLYEAHDYAAHGEIVDFVVLMTYEWGWAGGPPWAIAPVNEVREVLDYAVTVIPPEKILMGMPTYGRDWKLPFVEGETIASSISPQEAIRRAAQYGVAIQYDPLYQSPFYRYFDEQGVEHEVWFEDARSFQAKFNVVKEYGLRGVSYWVLGYPFPQNWALLADNFEIRKRVE
jgi:spore germination protein